LDGGTGDGVFGHAVRSRDVATDVRDYSARRRAVSSEATRLGAARALITAPSTILALLLFGVTCLVLGATGATGRLLVAQLLDRDQEVRVIVRSAERLPEATRNDPRLTITTASLSELDEATFAEQIDGCSAVASCLGHTLSLRGVLGPPYRLVRDATRRSCEAIVAAGTQIPVRFVLMDTAGVSNRNLGERRSRREGVVVGLLRVLLPPYADSEAAVEYLRVEVGSNNRAIEWAAVRPDTLLNEDAVSPYEVHPSPTRSPLFDAGKTSRINVAHFMAELMTGDEVWQRWKGEMPVIYNSAT
jgi:nucleoside-diphosphate-sugar epimerase